MKLDLTVNVPTMLTLLLFVVSSVTAGVRLYSGIDSRVTRTEYDINVMRDRVSTLEGNLEALRDNQAVQVQTLRSEIKSDLAEIKDTLNRLLFSRAPLAADTSR